MTSWGTLRGEIGRGSLRATAHLIQKHHLSGLQCEEAWIFTQRHGWQADLAPVGATEVGGTTGGVGNLVRQGTSLRRADYDLQDAIALETSRTNGQREFNGEPYYDIQIDSPDVTYLITVTVNYGKVFALFVKSPTRLFQQDEEKLRRIQETFRTL